jgi:site-specific recombinase XerC
VQCAAAIASTLDKKFPPAQCISIAAIPADPRSVTVGRVARGLRLKQERRVIMPLSAEEVAKFWQSFRTYRDLALVGLMLLDGLRSCEVLARQLEDVQLADGQMRVHGKGNKMRPLPLHPDILGVLGHYLRLERPLTNSPALFVSLKGHQRGRRS